MTSGRITALKRLFGVSSEKEPSGQKPRKRQRIYSGYAEALMRFWSGEKP